MEEKGKNKKKILQDSIIASNTMQKDYVIQKFQKTINLIELMKLDRLTVSLMNICTKKDEILKRMCDKDFYINRRDILKFNIQLEKLTEKIKIMVKNIEKLINFQNSADFSYYELDNLDRIISNGKRKDNV